MVWAQERLCAGTRSRRWLQCWGAASPGVMCKMEQVQNTFWCRRFLFSLVQLWECRKQPQESGPRFRLLCSPHQQVLCLQAGGECWVRVRRGRAAPQRFPPRRFPSHLRAAASRGRRTAGRAAAERGARREGAPAAPRAAPHRAAWRRRAPRSPRPGRSPPPAPRQRNRRTASRSRSRAPRRNSSAKSLRPGKSGRRCVRRAGAAGRASGSGSAAAGSASASPSAPPPPPPLARHGLRCRRGERPPFAPTRPSRSSQRTPPTSLGGLQGPPEFPSGRSRPFPLTPRSSGTCWARAPQPPQGPARAPSHTPLLGDLPATPQTAPEGLAGDPPTSPGPAGDSPQLASHGLAGDLPKRPLRTRPFPRSPSRPSGTCRRPPKRPSDLLTTPRNRGLGNT